MKNSIDNKKNFIIGIKEGLPICLGYFPIGMAFGLLAKTTALTLLEALGFSFIVFAGASQFMAVSMIGLGASGIEIIITTLFLNFRHFLMSASIASKANTNSFLSKIFISFYVTDESFSVASFTKQPLTKEYLISMELTGYFGWGIGTGVGFMIGNILPNQLQLSMGIGLYAMFIALLLPEIKKTNKALLLAVLSGILNTIFIYIVHIPSGWSIVISIIITSLFGTLIYYNEPDTEELKEVTSYE